MTAGQILRDWLDKNGRRHGHFAKAVGVTPGHLSKIINDRQHPSFDLILAMSKETKGAITLMTWHPELKGASK